MTLLLLVALISTALPIVINWSLMKRERKLAQQERVSR